MSEKVTKKTIRLWIDAQAKLKIYKTLESDLREKICSQIIPADKEKGTAKDSLFGFNFKAVAKLNRKVIKNDLKSIWKTLSTEEKNCIRFVPEVVESEYKKLPKTSKLHSVIESKPGMPTLEIK